MAGPDPIEDEFVRRVAAVAGVRNALDFDPEKLPALPAVTLSFFGVEQRDHQTGPAMELEWSWVVRVYVPLTSSPGSDYRRVQNQLKTILPELFRIVRADPSLGDTCDGASLTDAGSEPDYNHEQRRATKSLLLRARTEET